MIISKSSVSQTNLVAKAQPLPLNNSNIASSQQKPASDTTNEKVDMSNISLNEINQLIKSGVKGLLDIAPAVASELSDNYPSESEMNRKVNFIGQLEASIEFKRSQNENTDFLENVLSNVKKIDGMNMPTRVAIHV